LATNASKLDGVEYVTVVLTAVGVAELLLVDAVLVPPVLVAATVQVYGVPFVSPVTTKGVLVPVAVLDTPEAVQVAVKLVAVPPLVDAVNATEICPAPAVTDVMVGTPGAVTVAAGVTEALLADAALVPPVLVAATVQV